MFIIVGFIRFHRLRRRSMGKFVFQKGFLEHFFLLELESPDRDQWATGSHSARFDPRGQILIELVFHLFHGLSEGLFLLKFAILYQFQLPQPEPLREVGFPHHRVNREQPDSRHAFVKTPDIFILRIGSITWIPGSITSGASARVANVGSRGYGGEKRGEASLSEEAKIPTIQTRSI